MILIIVSKCKKPVFIFSIFFLLLLNCSDKITKPKDTIVTNAAFNFIDSSEPDSIKTLKSLKKEGDLYLITYYGDYDARLEELNDKIIKYGYSSVIPADAAYHECSIFSAIGDPESQIFGRNLDNNIDRGIMAGLFMPSDGYNSICITKLNHMGFDSSDDPTLLPVEQRLALLNCVLFVTDGMNECGVSIALATGENAAIHRDESKKLVQLGYLMRKVLDYAANVEEAVEIIENYDAFDVNSTTIANHLLIADPSGKSFIAEYHSGEWRVTPNGSPWQAATNTALFNVSEENRKKACWKYKRLCSRLEKADGNISWEEGMDILNSVSVSDTQWSTIYDMSAKSIYISLYRKYQNIYSMSIR